MFFFYSFRFPVNKICVKKRKNHERNTSWDVNIVGEG